MRCVTSPMCSDPITLTMARLKLLTKGKAHRFAHVQGTHGHSTACVDTDPTVKLGSTVTQLFKDADIFGTQAD